MLLHEHPEDFKDLQELTAEYIGIPAVAVERDYYIVMMLEKLAQGNNFTCMFFISCFCVFVVVDTD